MNTNPLLELRNAQLNIHEAIELVKTSRDLYNRKMDYLKNALKNEKDNYKIKELLSKADKLQKEYQESLQIIESYMLSVYKKVMN